MGAGPGAVDLPAGLLRLHGGGSTLWGLVAGRIGTSSTLAVCAASLLVGLGVAVRFPIAVGEGASLAPSRHWPAPLLAVQPEPERGPVLITLEYRIDPARADEFVRVMHRLGHSRQRGGALRWGLWQDASDPGRWLESFVDESWVEHLRHHERVTAEDRDLEAAAQAFHRGAEPPRVVHYLAGWRRR